jgi:4-hydroxy-tetrahydrodipicolinate reductase
MNKLEIGVSGVTGRMGRLIAEEVLQDSVLELGCAIEAKGHKSIGKKIGDVMGFKGKGPIISDNPESIASCKVFIEFTTPQATLEHLSICRDKGVAMVIGTTGMDKKIEGYIKEASSKIPIVRSPNMSTGVNLLFRLVKEAAGILGKDFNIEIIESHHRHKKDKPSGTAKRLARIISDETGSELPPGAIHSIRTGEVIGEHTVVFAGTDERIELVHKARNRRTFAKGAVKAAKFLANASPGLYTMKEVLCL